MAEKKVIELEVKTESVGNLKAELRKAQAEVTALAEKFGATSDQAIAAAKRAAELKDAIADAKALTDAYNPDAKFNALSSAIGGVLNGFQAFEGALGLVGVEGKAVEETLLKVQSAMALTQGINGVLEAKEDFARLGKQIGDVYGSAIKGFQNMTAAGKAFAVTGIGLLITGLGLVIAYWDDIKKAVGGVSEEERKLAEFRRKHEEERRDFVANESKDFASSLAQLKATNKGSKERSELITEINQKYGTTLKNLSDEAAFQNQINKELENYLKYQTAKFKLQANEEAIVRNLKEQSRLKQQIAEDEKNLQKLQEQAQKAGGITGLEAAKIKGVERAINENNDALNAAEKRFENYGKAALKAGDDIAKLTNNGKKYVEQNKEVVTKTKEATEELKRNADEGVLKLDTRKAEEIELVKNAEETKYNYLVYWGNLTNEYYEAQAEKRRENIKKNVDLALKYAQEFGNTMSALNNLLNTGDEERLKQVKKGSAEEQAIKKKMFDREKKMRIAQTIIDTASNIVQSVRNGGGIPAGIPFGVIAAAQGAIQIAAIKKATFGGGDESGGSSGSESPNAPSSNSIITPNFNIVGNAQATNPLSGLGGQPIQAYVVSGEVTTAQNLDRNRINYATFG